MMNYRHLFDGIEIPVKLGGRRNIIPINFDNGATTPPLKWVNETVRKNALSYGPIARGAGQKGDKCTEQFEASRESVLDFLNLLGRNDYSVIYVKNTTEGLNLLANVLFEYKDCTVLTTRMEHHANDLPWRHTAHVEYVEVDKSGRISLKEIENHLAQNPSIKFVTVTGASNVTGYINPIHEIARIVHRYDAKLIVDAAQLVAHRAINMAGRCEAEQIDFLVFSGHKMYAPYGAGAIVGLTSYLNNIHPFLRGGGAVDVVLDNDVIWSESPYLHEAGTQNYLGVMALVASMQVLKKIGFDEIEEHETRIKNYLLKELSKIPEVILYGDVDYSVNRLGVIVFNVRGMHFEEVAFKLASQFGIATRYGKFCAHPYVDRMLGINEEQRQISEHTHNGEDIGMVRISLGLYNTMGEAKDFIHSLRCLIYHH